MFGKRAQPLVHKLDTISSLRSFCVLQGDENLIFPSSPSPKHRFYHILTFSTKTEKLCVCRCLAESGLGNISTTSRVAVAFALSRSHLFPQPIRESFFANSGIKSSSSPLARNQPFSFISPLQISALGALNHLILLCRSSNSSSFISKVSSSHQSAFN